MDKPSTLFTGIFGAFLLSTGAMVLLPHSNISGLQPQVVWDEGSKAPSDMYPVKLEHSSGDRLGERIYVENGCFYCHSQQLRDPQYGPDIERGWGPRRTVARDYIYQDTPLLGSTRLGPDLSNYGWRDNEGKRFWRNEQANDPLKPTIRDAMFIYKHLFNPRNRVSNSTCPSYLNLFEQRDIGAGVSPEAVAVDGGKQWIPKADARYLAMYLLSLDRSHELKEAPLPNKEAKK
jgi:cytochrome c oxidase cbb3-type subunit II